MRPSEVIMLTLLLPCCGGRVEQGQPAQSDTNEVDATRPGEEGSATETHYVELADVEADVPSPWVWDGSEDVGGFPDAPPPLPGEFPPEGDKPCWRKDDPLRPACINSAFCEASGWCCHGMTVAGACRCGATLGCAPEGTCCLFPGEVQARCVYPASLCPTLSSF
jgi:hypothetical protein